MAVMICNSYGLDILCESDDQSRRPSEVKKFMLDSTEMEKLLQRIEKKKEFEKEIKKVNAFEYITNPARMKKRKKL